MITCVIFWLKDSLDQECFPSNLFLLRERTLEFVIFRFLKSSFSSYRTDLTTRFLWSRKRIKWSGCHQSCRPGRVLSKSVEIKEICWLNLSSNLILSLQRCWPWGLAIDLWLLVKAFCCIIQNWMYMINTERAELMVPCFPIFQFNLPTGKGVLSLKNKLI